jgi:hypothetical protein
MAKFLNKKEQVFDIQLTTYGRYLMSIGKLQPVYYAFFDDNILYDKRYCTGDVLHGTTVETTALPEPQNDIHKRIKQSTAYLESPILFTDIERHDEQIQNPGETQYVDATPQQQIARAEMFRFEKSIGDAVLDSDSNNYAPAWKVVALQNKISSSANRDSVTLSDIPQINITLEYEKQIARLDQDLLPDSVNDIIGSSRVFADLHTVGLKADDALIYMEEVNTALLVENFDIEVFQKETVTSCTAANGRIGLYEDFGGNHGWTGVTSGDILTINHNNYTVTITIKDSASGGPASGFVINTKEDTIADGGAGTGTATVLLDSYTEEESLAGVTEQSRGAELLLYLLEAIDNFGTELDIEGVQEGNLYDLTSDLSIVLVSATCGERSNDGEISLTVDDESAWILDSWAGGKDEYVRYKRKYFKKEYNNVQDGYMVANQPVTIPSTNYTTASVEYYFDILVDHEIDNELACKGAETFNKQSYYVDLDFDCKTQSEEAIYFDIYGRATEPEICQ